MRKDYVPYKIGKTELKKNYFLIQLNIKQIHFL